MGSKYPKKVLNVQAPCATMDYLLMGTLAGTKCEKLKLDSGAQQTVVRRALIPSDAYTNQSMILKGLGDWALELPLAVIELELEARDYENVLQ